MSCTNTGLCKNNCALLGSPFSGRLPPWKAHFVLLLGQLKGVRSARNDWNALDFSMLLKWEAAPCSTP